VAERFAVPILKFDGDRIGASALVPRRTIFQQLNAKSAPISSRFRARGDKNSGKEATIARICSGDMVDVPQFHTGQDEIGRADVDDISVA
jgi:hypothetical protein